MFSLRPLWVAFYLGVFSIARWGNVVCTAQISTPCTEVMSRAASSSPSTGPQCVESDSGHEAPEQFPRGTWDLQVNGAFVLARTNPRFEQFAGGSVGIGYYFRDRLSIQVDIPVYWLNQRQPGVAGGLDVMTRWHFLERGRLSGFLEGGAGLLVSQRDVPRAGTRFNFTPRFGIGATWMLDEQTYVFGGARLWHLSNAGAFGDDRNPSIDLAVMAYVGIGWKF